LVTAAITSATADGFAARMGMVMAEWNVGDVERSK
jgi:hypothetical protein